MKLKISLVVLLLLAIPFGAINLTEVDAETNDTIESYYYDGEYVYIVETVKMGEPTKLYTENGEKTYTEVRTTYKTSPEEPKSLVGLSYYNGNIFVASEDRELRISESEDDRLEQNVDGDWVPIYSDEEPMPNAVPVIVLIVAEKLVKALIKKVAKIVIRTAIENIKNPNSIGDLPPYEDKITEDISILRSAYHSVPLMFYVDGYATPVLEFNDETLKNLEPFYFYFVLGNTLSPSDLKGICPVGLSSSIARELMLMNSQMYNVYSPTADMSETLCRNLGEGMTWHEGDGCTTYGHVHFEINGSMSYSRAYYGLDNEKAWEPADGDQWWFD